MSILEFLGGKVFEKKRQKTFAEQRAAMAKSKALKKPRPVKKAFIKPKKRKVKATKPRTRQPRGIKVTTDKQGNKVFTNR